MGELARGLLGTPGSVGRAPLPQMKGILEMEAIFPLIGGSSMMFV